jgi:hypothetical protein
MRLNVGWTVLLGMSMALACKASDGYCPGLCAIDNLFPTMTVETADGRASIATAKIVSGPCVQLLAHSAGDAGVIDGYASVQVTYNGPVDSVPPLCLVEITSIYGEKTVITGEIAISTYQQACCPHDRCCMQETALSVHHRVDFKQPLQTVSLQVPEDAGSVEGYDGSQSVDADQVDASPVDAEPIDAGTIDASPVDAQLDEPNDDVAAGS